MPAQNLLSRWIKKLHTYTGLLSFTILLVFGIAGLTASFRPGQRGVAEDRELAFAAPANADDFAAAAAAYQFLHLRNSQPLSRPMVHRDSANNVAFTIYSVNGERTVTLLEKEQQLRVEQRHTSLWQYFNRMHATTANTRIREAAIRLWSWYTEWSIWALLFMAVSGVYLWLASRPGYRWAQVSFAAGSAAFLLLYALTR